MGNGQHEAREEKGSEVKVRGMEGKGSEVKGRERGRGRLASKEKLQA